MSLNLTLNITHQFFSLKAITIYLLLMFAGAACKNDNKPSTSIADSLSKVNSAQDPAQNIAELRGNLDILYIKSSVFRDLRTLPNGRNRKLILEFYVNTLDSLTLRGWQAKANGTTFDNDPVLSFQHGPKDTTYGPGNYFGSLVINKDEVTVIKSQINGTYPFLVFDPFIDSKGHIFYKVLLSSEEPAMNWTIDKTRSLRPTGVIANPSPPKSFD